MNDFVYESSAVNRYATFFFAIYDTSSRELTYSNAGHNPPVLIRETADSVVRRLRLEAGGIVIGLLPDATYEAECLTLEAGDLLVAYTDGVTEALSEKKEEEWGEDRMLRATEAVRRRPAEDILRAVFEAADQFTGKAPQQDDMTLLLLKVSPTQEVSQTQVD